MSDGGGAPTNQQSVVDGLLLRQVAGRFATGVTVLTVKHEGEVRGITVNSFTSVSLAPPLVLINLDRRARGHDLLSRASHFALSILAADQQALSDRFAGRLGDLQGKFDDIPHTLSPSGAPYLDGVLGTMHCRVSVIHPGGDHDIFVAVVEEAALGADAEPLLFFRGRYSALAPT